MTHLTLAEGAAAMRLSEDGTVAPVDHVPGLPGPGEVLMRQTFAGVNFVDVYHRRGIYPLAEPRIPGVEAVGTVLAAGPGVEGVARGDRVAWAGLPAGGYAAARVIAADRLIPLPAEVPDDAVAGRLLRGLTAALLIEALELEQGGRTVLVQAAAGGLGLILTRWLSGLGHRVIGTVSTPAKARLAMAAGLSRAVLYRDEDVVEVVREVTGGAGADAAIDGIGGGVLPRSLAATRRFGRVASIGRAGGAAPEIASPELTNRWVSAVSVLARLADPGFAGPAFAAWRAAPGFGETGFGESGVGESGAESFPLAEAARALEALEAGETAGAVRLEL